MVLRTGIAISALLLAGCTSRVEPIRSPAVRTSVQATGLTGLVAYSTAAGHIWVMNADGTNRRQLTHGSDGIDLDPSLSPDGRSVVFRTTRDRFPDPHGFGLDGIRVVGVDGSGEHSIAPPSGGLFPAWSPKGDEIALSSLDSSGQESIFLVRPDGSGLTDLHAAGEGASWSPDGSAIVYSHQTYSPNGFDIWAMRSDGSGQHALVTGPRDDNPGAWSPDGSRIAFSSQRSGNYDVYVMNADGSHVTQLTRSPNGESPDAWLRDGRIVVAVFANNAPQPDWFVMQADGSNVLAVPELAGAADPLDWVPA